MLERKINEWETLILLSALAGIKNCVKCQSVWNSKSSLGCLRHSSELLALKIILSICAFFIYLAHGISHGDSRYILTLCLD